MAVSAFTKRKKISQTHSARVPSLFDILRTDFSRFDMQKYRDFVAENGIANAWREICKFLFDCGETDFFCAENFGELYEIALAQDDKGAKKATGQYFTPDDVARIMAKWLCKLQGENVCDVACGTGNLVLSYLQILGKTKAKKLIESGRLYLYDSDETALKICETAILLRYGLDLNGKINIVAGDFLDEKTKLPSNCKVISNPPYAKIEKILPSWKNSEIQRETKEFYAAFMEKIFDFTENAVIITPYSFLGGGKYYNLRQKMNEKSGFVISFDNIPGNIFLGRKHGIFNTNKTNSVRATITVAKCAAEKGFQISSLIRFSRDERQNLLKCETLESFAATKRQIVDEKKPAYRKIDARLLSIYEKWLEKSNGVLGDYAKDAGEFSISLANTCRYRLAASAKPMKRGGQITFFVDEKAVFDYLFCLINSSFAYWHWRIFDGGITYQKGLFFLLPTFFGALSEDDKKFFAEISAEMIAKSDDFIVTKNNVGVQENLKFPREYCDKINGRFLRIFQIDADAKIFDIIHSKAALEIRCD